jgi:hypothetical protein
MLSRTLGVIAALGFLASAIVHVATFWDISAQTHSVPTWPLHLGVFVVFAPAVVVVSQATQGQRIASLTAGYPPAAFAGAAFLTFYTHTVGLVSLVTSGGAPRETIYGYQLVNRGQFIRDLTRSEFLHLHALNERGFSAVWMLFYGLSALFWLFLEPRTASDDLPAARRV